MRSRATLMFIILGQIILLGTIGCDTVPSAGLKDPLGSKDYPHIVVVDDLEDDLVFGTPNLRRSPDRPMSVAVPVRIMTDDENTEVQYRFDFLDSSGRPLDPSMGWRYMQLPSQAQRFMEAAALDMRAVDWRLEVRPAR